MITGANTDVRYEDICWLGKIILSSLENSLDPLKDIQSKWMVCSPLPLMKETIYALGHADLMN